MLIASKHEGLRYPCDKCKYAATTSGSLKMLIESKHKGVRYPCDKCKYTATQVGDLKLNIESKHEGVTARNLKQHIKRKHEEVRFTVINVNTLQLKTGT